MRNIRKRKKRWNNKNARKQKLKQKNLQAKYISDRECAAPQPHPPLPSDEKDHVCLCWILRYSIWKPSAILTEQFTHLLHWLAGSVTHGRSHLLLQVSVTTQFLQGRGVNPTINLFGSPQLILLRYPNRVFPNPPPGKALDGRGYCTLTPEWLSIT